MPYPKFILVKFMHGIHQPCDFKFLLYRQGKERGTCKTLIQSTESLKLRTALKGNFTEQNLCLNVHNYMRLNQAFFGHIECPV